jgi:hypothetical protein
MTTTCTHRDGLFLRAGGGTEILRNNPGWPNRPTSWPGGKRWLRGRPGAEGETRLPSLNRAVTGAVSEPDGLWIGFVNRPQDELPVAVDLFAIEICGTDQNLYDKRSRFLPATSSLTLRVQKSWLDRVVTVQRGATRRRFEAVDSFQTPPGKDLHLPVRSIRVLYVLPNDPRHRSARSGLCLFHRALISVPLEGHEYLLEQSRLSQARSTSVQELIKRMLLPHCRVDAALRSG